MPYNFKIIVLQDKWESKCIKNKIKINLIINKDKIKRGEYKVFAPTLNG